MNNKILSVLVVGSSGQLGSEIYDLQTKYQSYSFTFLKRKDLDISCINSLDKFVGNQQVDVIINCAAYTNVVKAEVEVEEAKAANVQGVYNLSFVAKKFSIKLIHISTDCVFDGRKNSPYIETDETNPVNVYSKTKLNGEIAMLSVNPENSIIIRTSWVYSKYGVNFVKTMLNIAREKKSIKVVNDQFGTPTYARDLAESILAILPKISCKKVQIYHYSNEGSITWFDFAKEIFKQSGVDCKVFPISTIEYGASVTRPYYCVMDKEKFKNNFGVTIPYWTSSLNHCLQNLENNYD